jgi:SagB-type dehydrogenase family enzyme
MRSRFGFLSTPVGDPRRIQLRQRRFLEAFLGRGEAEDVTEVSHELTKLRRLDDKDISDMLQLIGQPGMMSVLYRQDVEFPLRPRVTLPKPEIPEISFPRVVYGRRSDRHFAGGGLAPQDFGCLLFGALGETAILTAGFEDEVPVNVSLRSIPSGGGLNPTRGFVAALPGGGLPAGIYHYDAPDHALELVKTLSDQSLEMLFAAFPIHPQGVDLSRAAAIFFITTKFWRSRAKYGPRGYRYCLQEAGAACQNLNLMAVACGLAHVVLGGFYDDEVHSCLGIDGVDHAVVTAIAVGVRSEHAEVGASHAGV